MKNMAENQSPPANEKRPSRFNTVIIVLSVLLALSAGGLAARYIYFNFVAPNQATVTVPDNLIGKEENSDSSSSNAAESEDNRSGSVQTGSGVVNGSGSATQQDTARPSKAVVLRLDKGQPNVSEKFEAGNMLPGDSVRRYFCIKANHAEDFTLYFSTEITEQTKNLGDVLHIKVTHLDSGKVLCDSAFSKVDKQEFSQLFTKNSTGQTDAYYQIDVSVDTCAGNQYQAAALKATFNWYVKDSGGLTPPPQTGDDTNILLWSTLALSSAGMLLLILMRKKEEQNHEQE